MVRQESLSKVKNVRDLNHSLFVVATQASRDCSPEIFKNVLPPTSRAVARSA